MQQNWPPLVRALVDYYGPERVWRSGIDTLGFPATWITTISEANAIADHLGKER